MGHNRTVLLRAVVVAICLLYLSATVRAQLDNLWTNSAGGNWNDDANWDIGAPSVGITGVIAWPGTYTVEVTDSQVDFASFEIGGTAGGVQTVAIRSGGMLRPTGVAMINSNGVLVIEAGGVLDMGSQALTVEGTLVMAGGEVRGQAGSRVAVASGGELNIAALTIFTSADVVASSGSTVKWASGDIRMIGGDAPLASSLLFRVRSGASLDVTDTGVSAAIEAVNATASFVIAGHFDFQADDCQRTINIPSTVSGLVSLDAADATLVFGANSAWSGADLSLAGTDAVLDLNGADVTWANVDGTGSGGAVALANDDASLTLSGTNALDITLTLSAGVVAQPSGVTTLGMLKVEAPPSGQTTPSLTVASDLRLSAADVGGTLFVARDGSVAMTADGAGGLNFRNLGALTAAPGIASGAISLAVANGTSIVVPASAQASIDARLVTAAASNVALGVGAGLQLGGGGTVDGDLVLGSGSVLTLNDTTVNGSALYDVGFSASGDGRLTVAAPTTYHPASVDVPLTLAAGGSLALTSPLNVTHPFTWSGGRLSGSVVEIGPSAAIDFVGDGQRTLEAVIENYGTIVFAGGSCFFGPGAGFRNEEGGLLVALGASSLGSPSFDLVNHGTLNVTTTGPDVAFAIGANFVNTNLTLVKRGGLVLTGGCTNTGAFDLATDTSLTMGGAASPEYHINTVDGDGHVTADETAVVYITDAYTAASTTIDGASVVDVAVALILDGPVTCRSGTLSVHTSLAMTAPFAWEACAVAAGQATVAAVSASASTTSGNGAGRALAGVAFANTGTFVAGGNGTTLMSDSASFVNNGTVTAPTGSSSAFLGASADSGATWIAGGSPATGVTVEAGASFGLGGATTLSPSTGFLDTCADGAMLFFTGSATVTGFDMASNCTLSGGGLGASGPMADVVFTSVSANNLVAADGARLEVDAAGPAGFVVAGGVQVSGSDTAVALVPADSGEVVLSGATATASVSDGASIAGAGITTTAVGQVVSIDDATADLAVTLVSGSRLDVTGSSTVATVSASNASVSMADGAALAVAVSLALVDTPVEAGKGSATVTVDGNVAYGAGGMSLANTTLVHGGTLSAAAANPGPVVLVGDAAWVVRAPDGEVSIPADTALVVDATGSTRAEAATVASSLALASGSSLALDGGRLGVTGPGTTMRVGDGAVVTVGSGTQVADGASLVLDSGATVDCGPFCLVSTGGIMAGNGAFKAGAGGVVVGDGGVLSPGGDAAVGELTIDGALNLTNAGAAIAFEAASATEADSVVVLGSAALGGTLRVSEIDAYAPAEGESFTVLTATDGRTGEMDGVAMAGAHGGVLAYTDNEVVLTYADGSGSLVVDPETLPIELILVSFGAACFLACVGLLTILGLPRLVRESIYVLRDEAGAVARAFAMYDWSTRILSYNIEESMEALDMSTSCIFDTVGFVRAAESSFAHVGAKEMPLSSTLHLETRAKEADYLRGRLFLRLDLTQATLLQPLRLRPKWTLSNVMAGVAFVVVVLQWVALALEAQVPWWTANGSNWERFLRPLVGDFSRSGADVRVAFWVFTGLSVAWLVALALIRPHMSRYEAAVERIGRAVGARGLWGGSDSTSSSHGSEADGTGGASFAAAVKRRNVRHKAHAEARHGNLFKRDLSTSSSTSVDLVAEVMDIIGGLGSESSHASGRDGGAAREVAPIDDPMAMDGPRGLPGPSGGDSLSMESVGTDGSFESASGDGPTMVGAADRAADRERGDHPTPLRAAPPLSGVSNRSGGSSMAAANISSTSGGEAQQILSKTGGRLAHVAPTRSAQALLAVVLPILGEMLLVPIVRTAASMWACHSVGGTSVLVVDPSFACWGGTHWGYAIVAAVVFLGYAGSALYYHPHWRQSDAQLDLQVLPNHLTSFGALLVAAAVASVFYPREPVLYAVAMIAFSAVALGAVAVRRPVVIYAANNWVGAGLFGCFFVSCMVLVTAIVDDSAKRGPTAALWIGCGAILVGAIVWAGVVSPTLERRGKDKVAARSGAAVVEEAEASSTAGGDDEPFQDGSDSASSGNGDGNEDPAFMTAEMSGERDDNGGDHDTPRGVVGGLAWASPLANPRALDDIETPKRDALDLSAGSDGGYSTEGHDLA